MKNNIKIIDLIDKKYYSIELIDLSNNYIKNIDNIYQFFNLKSLNLGFNKVLIFFNNRLNHLKLYHH